MTPRDVGLSVLVVAVFAVVGWRKARRGDQRRARRAAYRGRIEQARRESPADFVAASADLLVAELRRVPARLVWPLAEQIGRDLAAAVAEVDTHTVKGGRA